MLPRIDTSGGTSHDSYCRVDDDTSRSFSRLLAGRVNSVSFLRAAGEPVDPDQMDLTVFGRPVSVLLPPDHDHELRLKLHEAWSRCTPARRAEGLESSVYDGRATVPLVCDVRSSAQLLEGPAGGARLADNVTTAVTTHAMKAVLGQYLLLHAAGLAADDGRVVALCAPSGTGKTTATRVLARAFGYVTDETVAIEPRTGRVLPYPKPLQIIDRSIGSRKVAIGPDELGLREPSDPASLRLGPVVLLDRSLAVDDPLGPRIEPIPLAEALPRIVAQTSSLHLLERPLQTLCSLLDRHGGPWTLRYSEAQALPALLKNWLASDAVQSPGPELWSPLPEGPQGATTGPATPADLSAATADEAHPAWWARTEVHDAVRVSDVIVVLRGEELVVLQGIGATLWEHLAHPRSLPELTAGLVEVHGPVADAESRTARLVEQLMTHGLLAPAPLHRTTTP